MRSTRTTAFPIERTPIGSSHIALSLPIYESISTDRNQRPRAIREAIDRRNEYVHRLPKPDWESLSSGAQLQDHLEIDWNLESFPGRDIPSVEIETDNLERKFRDVMQFLSSLRNELDEFEFDFCRLLYEAPSLPGHG